MTTENLPLAVSIADAAKLSGLGRSSIYNAINSGALKVRKAGRRSIIATADLNAWIDAMPSGGSRRAV